MAPAHRSMVCGLALVTLAGCGGGAVATDADTAAAGSSSGPGPGTSATGATESTGAPASTGGDAPTTTAPLDGTTGAPVKLDVGVVPGSSTDGASAGTSTGGEPIDCASIPPGPFAFITHGPIGVSEDFAIDSDGNAVGQGGNGIFRTPLGGAPVLWVPGISDFIAGIRFTSEGILVYNNASNNTLYRINEVDAPQVVLGGLNYPNGMDVDLDGNVIVAEQAASRVRRIDPETGEFEVLAENIPNANGVSFSPDYRTVYAGSFGGGEIHAIHLDEDGVPQGSELFRGSIGGGALDGMAVDACGNVYVCEYGPGIVWRIPPDASAAEQVAQLPSNWIPNMQFGTGVGGWTADSLFVISIGGGAVYEIPVGVPDKPRAYP